MWQTHTFCIIGEVGIQQISLWENICRNLITETINKTMQVGDRDDAALLPDVFINLRNNQNY